MMSVRGAAAMTLLAIVVDLVWKRLRDRSVSAADETTIAPAAPG
jgi:hypothetical protein